jgi:hypothetical protein
LYTDKLINKNKPSNKIGTLPKPNRKEHILLPMIKHKEINSKELIKSSDINEYYRENLDLKKVFGFGRKIPKKFV